MVVSSYLSYGINIDVVSSACSIKDNQLVYVHIEPLFAGNGRCWHLAIENFPTLSITKGYGYGV